MREFSNWLSSQRLRAIQKNAAVFNQRVLEIEIQPPRIQALRIELNERGPPLRN